MSEIALSTTLNPIQTKQKISHCIYSSKKWTASHRINVIPLPVGI